MSNHLILSGQPLNFIMITACISLSYLGSQVSYGQEGQQVFTAPKFGLSMQYPADWTFVPEREDFSAENDNYMMVPLGDFCPTSAVGPEPEVLDCHMNLELNVPAYLGVTIFKVETGTTLEEFYDQKTKQFEASDDLTGRKNIEKNKITVSGLAAIQRVDIVGGGSMDKLLESMGQETTKSKVIDVYVVKGDLGYRFFGDTNDEKEFETYSPIFNEMIKSVHIE